MTWTDGVPALAGGRCAACDTHTFPAATACPRCGATTIDAVPLPTTGTVWTWTVQRLPPKPPFRAPEPFTPFAVGYVDLGPVKVETRLVGRPADAWTIGDDVELVVDHDAAFAFQPVGA